MREGQQLLTLQVSLTTVQEASAADVPGVNGNAGANGYDSDGRASTPSLEMMSDDEEER